MRNVLGEARAAARWPHPEALRYRPLPRDADGANSADVCLQVGLFNHSIYYWTRRAAKASQLPDKPTFNLRLTTGQP